MLLTCMVNTQAQIEVEVEDEEIIVSDEYGDVEEIDFPEAMADNMMDSLMNLYESKSYLTVDEDCRTTGENPLFSKEEYIERLMRMPTVMEMSYNEVVRSCIDRYAAAKWALCLAPLTSICLSLRKHSKLIRFPWS